jgi:hypothetical protein
MGTVSGEIPCMCHSPRFGGGDNNSGGEKKGNLPHINMQD